jgi:phosphotransferase system HPr (HPr) family protein
MTEHTSIQLKVRVTPENGLHLAPISQLVRTATAYSSAISLSFDGKRADVKSAFDLMLLGAPCGAELHLEIHGADAHAAASAISQLFESGFSHHA